MNGLHDLTDGSGDQPMSQDHDSIFRALHQLLRRHAERFEIETATDDRFSLVAAPGPATLEAWGGKLRRATVPVAWVERTTSYVGYHLMGLNGNAALVESLSPALRARMHGKTCFNFRRLDKDVLTELDVVTRASLDAMQRGGFIDLPMRQSQTNADADKAAGKR